MTYSVFGGMLNFTQLQPKHCSNSVQPIPKAVYHIVILRQTHIRSILGCDPGILCTAVRRVTTRLLRLAELKLMIMVAQFVVLVCRDMMRIQFFVDVNAFGLRVCWAGDMYSYIRYALTDTGR